MYDQYIFANKNRIQYKEDTKYVHHISGYQYKEKCDS